MLFTKRKYDASHGISVAAAYILLYTVGANPETSKRGLWSSEYAILERREGGGGEPSMLQKTLFHVYKMFPKLSTKEGAGWGFGSPLNPSLYWERMIPLKFAQRSIYCRLLLY